MSEERPTVMQRLRVANGQQIREARELRGWTQTQLADAAGTNQQTIDRIERGVTGNSKSLPRIMEALGIKTNVYSKHIQSVSNMMLEQSGSNDIKEALEAFRRNSVDRLPIYARSDGGLVLTNSLSPQFPVELVNGAYGLLISETDMDPALRRGDIAIVNPHLPVEPTAEVVVFHREQGVASCNVLTLMAEADEHWGMRTWSPRRDVVIPKGDGYVLHMVVSKISRYR